MTALKSAILASLCVFEVLCNGLRIKCENSSKALSIFKLCCFLPRCGFMQQRAPQVTAAREMATLFFEYCDCDYDICVVVVVLVVLVVVCGSSSCCSCSFLTISNFDLHNIVSFYPVYLPPVHLLCMSLPCCPEKSVCSVGFPIPVHYPTSLHNDPRVLPEPVASLRASHCSPVFYLLDNGKKRDVSLWPL